MGCGKGRPLAQVQLTPPRWKETSSQFSQWPKGMSELEETSPSWAGRYLKRALGLVWLILQWLYHTHQTRLLFNGPWKFSSLFLSQDYGELRCRMNREAATGLRISVDAKGKRPSCGVAKRSLGGSGMLVQFSWEWGEVHRSGPEVVLQWHCNLWCFWTHEAGSIHWTVSTKRRKIFCLLFPPLESCLAYSRSS